MDAALLVFAFSAGAAAFFAPCCVAMLPAYVAYAVWGDAAPEARRATATSRALALLAAALLLVAIVPLALAGLGAIVELPYEVLARLPRTDASVALLLAGLAALVAALLASGRARAAARGAAFGLLATLGLLAVFLAVGLPVALAARALAAYLPHLALADGLGLVVLGALMLAGRGPALRAPALSTSPTTRRGFVLFGVGYGLASLSCTFPIFLAVMGAGLLAGGLASGLGVFAAYALGKAVLLVVLTAASVAGGGAARARLGPLAPRASRAAALLVVASGLYVAWYYGRGVLGA